MAHYDRNQRNRSSGYGDWESGRPRETGYWSGRDGDEREIGYPGQREYSDDYPSYGSQYGRDRDFGYAGDRNRWSEQNRPYSSRRGRFGGGYRGGEQESRYWPDQENPYRRNTSVLGDSDEDYGSYRSEGRDFGGYEGSGRRQPRYGGEPRMMEDRYGRYSARGNDYDERGWWDRATDEVASWFGDDDAERRRRMDESRSHRGRGPKGYKRSDERIKEDISDRFSEDHWLDASDIEIEVSGGEVTLSGTVESRAAKYRAEMMAENCSGVIEVQNNLRVTKHTESPSTYDSNASAQSTRNKTTTY